EAAAEMDVNPCRGLGGLPSPLWGGVGGGGSSWRTPLAQQLRPPSPPLPHKGGGSRPSLPHCCRPTFSVVIPAKRPPPLARGRASRSPVIHGPSSLRRSVVTGSRLGARPAFWPGSLGRDDDRSLWRRRRSTFRPSGTSSKLARSHASAVNGWPMS